MRLDKQKVALAMELQCMGFPWYRVAMLFNMTEAHLNKDIATARMFGFDAWNK